MKIYYFILILFCFSGCALKNMYLADNFNYQEAYLNNIAMQSFSLVDDRPVISEKVLKISIFSWPGETDTIHPKISSEQRDLIKNEILKHINNKGKKYHITVHITKGEKTFKSTWFGDHEYVKVGMKIIFLDEYSTFQSFAEVFMDVRSFLASNEYIEKLYKKVTKECVHRCFANIKEMAW